MKEVLKKELPLIIEQVKDEADAIANPSAIWLEAMQFADYVYQYALHLKENHGEDCVQEVAETLEQMSQSFKQVAELSMTRIDEVEKIIGT